MQRPIYLDHHATTPLDAAALDAMMPYLTDAFGNAASKTHPYGWEAEEAVETAREQIAALIRAKPEEIVFTSGATESDNLALKGVAMAYRERGRHIITSPTEHKAVLDTCHYLEQHGFEITYLPVDRAGLVNPDDVRRAITSETILISIMHANSEIGTIAPVADIGAIARERGVLFHSDAVQSVGKILVDVNAMQVDLLSISGHKIYGPKGVGALYVRKTRPERLRLEPTVHGGGQERGVRSGTLNVPGIVGLGKACEVCREVMPEEGARLKRLRQRLYEGLTSRLDDVYLNGHADLRVPGNLNLCFARVQDESLLLSLKDIVALSAGSACTSDSHEPSYVIQALGVDPYLAHSAIRFGLGRHTTEAQIDTVIDAVVEKVGRLRALAPASAPISSGS